MSARQLQGRFTEEIGIPPGSYVERVRVEAARRALAEGPEQGNAVLPDRTLEDVTPAMDTASAADGALTRIRSVTITGGDARSEGIAAA